MGGQLRAIRDLPVYRPRSMPKFEHDALTFHLELYRRLGPVYRMRSGLSPMLVMGGVDVNEFVYKNSDLWDYGRRMQFCREVFHETCILQLDGEAHAQKRRRMVPALRQTSLFQQIPAMSEAVFERIHALPDGFHPDLRELGKHLTVSMTSVALLSRPLPPAVADQIDQFSRHMIQSDNLGPLRHLWYYTPAYRRVCAGLRATINQILAEREAHPPSGDDILGLMLKVHPAEAPRLSRAEIVNDLLFLLEAGAGTVAQILVWALMYIYHDPKWLMALREEVEDWNIDTFQGAHSYPRLQATVLEIERLRTPVPYFTLLPMRDFIYQDIQIPKRMPIFHLAALPHFLAEVYEDPFSFKPERFLKGMHFSPKTQATFGGGKHFCAGQSLAQMEIALAIAQIVGNYDLIFDPAPSFRPEMDTVITPATAVPVRFVPRALRAPAKPEDDRVSTIALTREEK